LNNNCSSKNYKIALSFALISSFNKTALNSLLCDALGKFKRRTRASRNTVWEPWCYCGQGRRNGVHYRALPPLIFEKGGGTGAQVPLHASIISNFMIYQDQFETNLLQLFTHT